jgi:predicted dehydrogenase
VHCTEGFIDLDPAFSYRGQRLRIRSGDGKKGNAEDKELPLEAVNHFTAEMDYFSGCVLENTAPRTPGEMGLADLRIIAAIEEAARTGRSVKLAAGPATAIL